MLLMILWSGSAIFSLWNYIPQASISVDSGHSGSIGGELGVSDGGSVFLVHLLTHSNVRHITVLVWREGEREGRGSIRRYRLIDITIMTCVPL